MIRFVLALCLVVSGLGPALAESGYPSRPIRFIVPFAAGGSTDTLARILSQAIGKRLGQTLVVENVGGAGGTIGTTQVAHATADGYTILAATPGLTINPHIQKAIAYDPVRDFAPVIQCTTSPVVLVVRAASPIHSVQDVIDMAKAKAGHVTYGTAGVGSSDHLSSATFAAMAKIQMTHIPYRGAGPAMVDLLAGQTDLQFENAASVMPQVKGGQLRAIAVGTAQSSPLLPGVPTIAATVPGYESSSWFGILAPAGTPQPIVDKLNAEVNEVLKSPDTTAQLAALGLTAVGGTPDAFSAFVKHQVAAMTQAAQAADLKPQ